MKVVIFTEGGGAKGLGHLVRCKALADEFAKRGFEVALYADKAGVIPPFMDLFESFEWSDTRRLCEDADIAVVDSYHASKSTLSDISKSVKTVLYFDDFNRDIYENGFVLNAAGGADTLGYRQSANIKYLLGQKFVILRSEFAKSKYRKKSGYRSRILISFGGVDNKNVAAKISKFLLKKHNNLKLSIVAKSKPKRAVPHASYFSSLSGTEFKGLMYSHRIGIFSCSQTLYEAMSTGLPSIGVLTEQNQQSLCKGFAASLDFADRFFFHRLDKKLARLARTATRALDANGAARVADILLKDAASKAKITFKNILECDRQTQTSLREWRNQPFVREQMTTTHEISETEHTLWLKSLRGNGARLTFVAFLGGAPFGVCNLAIDNDSGEIGFYIFRANLLGFGLGEAMCRGFLTLISGLGGIKTLDSRVLRHNTPSLRLHQKLGFSVCGEDGENYFLSKSNV